MPLHLPPLTRRRFLATSLALGAGLCTWRDALGQDADADRWILLADTHIAANRAQVNRGVTMADNLQRVVAALAQLTPRPAGVFLDGDAAFNKGEPGDYTLLGELLQPLRESIPIHVALGNHDDRDHFRAGLARDARPPLASRQVAVIESPRANWVVLDSLDKVNATPGVLGKEQLGWLARALDERTSKPALVVVHHDPQWTPMAKRSGLVDTEALFEVLVPRKQVKAVIYGHTHRWRRSERDGIHLLNLPPVAYLFQAGDPNGWVDVRLRDGGAALTLHALDASHRQNGEVVELAWR